MASLESSWFVLLYGSDAVSLKTSKRAAIIQTTYLFSFVDDPLGCATHTPEKTSQTRFWVVSDTHTISAVVLYPLAKADVSRDLILAILVSISSFPIVLAMPSHLTFEYNHKGKRKTYLFSFVDDPLGCATHTPEKTSQTWFWVVSDTHTVSAVFLYPLAKAEVSRDLILTILVSISSFPIVLAMPSHLTFEYNHKGKLKTYLFSFVDDPLGCCTNE